jgi:DNA repair protein RadD
VFDEINDHQPKINPPVSDDVSSVDTTSSGITLHPFQAIVVAQIEAAIAAGIRRILICCPTGGGKTIVASDKIKTDTAFWKPSLFLAHRREIIKQTADKLAKNGVTHGVIMAGCNDQLRPQSMVQVGSIDTIRARALNGTALRLPPAHVVWIDEAHHARAETYERLLAEYPDAIVIGLTATPVRGDGRGLGNIFELIIKTPQTAELIKLGFLVPSRVYAPVLPDVADGVRVERGDFVISQLAKRMNTKELVGDIVEHWLKYSERRRTIAFACNVEHSVAIRDQFIANGVRAEHLEAGTPLAEREAILERLHTGGVEVVCNFGILTEGFDCPPVGCLILARPTKQLGLYRQMVGRGLRPYEGKSDCIVLDHGGLTYRHGFAEDDIAWTLDVDERAANKAHEKRKASGVQLHECPQCHAVMSIPPCSACGWMPKPRARDVDIIDGELGLVQGGRAERPVYDPRARERFHAMLFYIERERGYRPKWARANYRDKFGCWPPSWTDPAPIEPTPEVRSWVRSKMIAYAKRRRAA